MSGRGRPKTARRSAADTKGKASTCTRAKPKSSTKTGDGPAAKKRRTRSPRVDVDDSSAGSLPGTSAGSLPGPSAGTSSASVGSLPTTTSHQLTSTETSSIMEMMASIVATQQQLVSEINSIKTRITSSEETVRGNYHQTSPDLDILNPATINFTEHENEPSVQEQFSVATEQLQTESFSNTTAPIGLFLKESVKTQIALGKFIDFNSLLETDEPANSSWVVSNNGETISFSRSEKKKRSLTWADWVRAWNLYMPLVCQAKGDISLPTRMAYHFATVQTLYSTGLDWSYYDTQFRRLLAQPEQIRGKLDWGSLHAETWLKANVSKNRMVGSGSVYRPAPKQGGFVPKGFCFLYHSKGVFCNNNDCKYKHICFKCKKPHPVHKCLFRTPFQKPFRNNTKSFGQKTNPSPLMSVRK